MSDEIGDPGADVRSLRSLPAGHGGGPATESCRLGLRERKKLRTYETIAAVALELFDRAGFRATTIAQIADAADVSPRTVSAYFPAKEDLLFPHGREAFADLERRLVERAGGELASDALRAWIASMFDTFGDKHEHDRELMRRRVIDGDESLRAYERHQLEHAEDVLAAAIARDLGVEPGDVVARLAAAAAVGALTAIGRAHDAGGLDADPAAHRAAALALVDQAIVFLRGGIRELQSVTGEPPVPQIRSAGA